MAVMLHVGAMIFADNPARDSTGNQVAAPAIPTPTERELARLCRASQDSARPQTLFRPVALSLEDFDPHHVIEASRMTLDWRCYVSGRPGPDELSCRTRPDGPTIWRLRTSRAGQFEAGNVVDIKGARRAVLRERKASVRVTTDRPLFRRAGGCQIELDLRGTAADRRTASR